MPPFVPGPGPMPGMAGSHWGPAGYSPGGSLPGAPAAPTASGAKNLVERVAKGEILPGADSATRLVQQCNATKTTAKQLAEAVCERTGRLYLGLDGIDDSDAALLRLLGLVEALAKQDGDFAKMAVEEIKKGTTDQFLSLRSNAKHKDAAEPLLRSLGMIAGAPKSAPAATVDLLGGDDKPQEANLLGNNRSSASRAAEVDLLGGVTSSPAPASAPAAPTPAADLLLGLDSTPATGSSSPWTQGAGDLAGLNLDLAAPGPTASVGLSAGAASPAPGTMGAGAVLPEKKSEDIFGFVGAEMTKASAK